MYLHVLSSSLPPFVWLVLWLGRKKKKRTRSGHEVERWRQSLQPGSLVDALDPNNTWTNATVVDTRERLGAPVVLGVGPMGGGGAGECCLFRVVSLQNRVHTEQERERERERERLVVQVKR